MTYDNEGRLTGWTAPSGTTASDSFLYDNEGNRVLQRTNDSNSITDTITFDSYLETVLHNGTTSTTKYYSVGGQRLAMRSGTALSLLYYLVNDMQGGTSLVLTSGGGVQAVQLYAPYGAVRYSQGTVPTTYNYTGQRLDSETGLLYYGFRYYDPFSGNSIRCGRPRRLILSFRHSSLLYFSSTNLSASSDSDALNSPGTNSVCKASPKPTRKALATSSHAA